jgi:translation initiation factor 1 (eIF-1/SUI1)
VLLAIFLQGDILEMKRITEIGPRFFQQEIKYAFATGATIADTEIDFNGTKVAGKTVTITPYVDEPKAETNERFNKFKHKTYTFTVSEQIPGFIYSIRTFVAAPKDAADQSQPLNEEVLQLTAVEPLQQPVAKADSETKAAAAP